MAMHAFVGIVGLKKQPELNGKRAVIVGSDRDRWVVELFGDRRQVSIRPSNLLTVPEHWAQAAKFFEVFTFMYERLKKQLST